MAESGRHVAPTAAAWKKPMLSKYSNPSCAGTFRYLHEGKIFHLIVDTVPQKRRDRSGAGNHRTLLAP